MMNLTLTVLMACQVLSFQGGQDEAKLTIWEEIARVEEFVTKSINKAANSYAVMNRDPVRGYHVERIGVVILIPMRYRTLSADFRREGIGPRLEGDEKPVMLDRASLERQMRQWNETLRKERLLKESDFEKNVELIKESLPKVLTMLDSLPPTESLSLVVEEREPAWFAGLSLEKNGSRKIVTLTISRELLSQIHANKTILTSAWLKNVKRTTTSRRLVAIP